MPQSQVLQNSKTDAVTTKSINFNGRQITNAGDAVNPQDYVTLGQMQSAVTAAIPKETTNRTQININGVVKNGQPGAVLFVGLQGQLSQDSLNFNYAGAGKLNIVGLNVSSLTASKPTKTDASKNLTSGLIVLTSDVSGILPVPNGGSGLATLTAHAVLLGEGAGVFGLATIGTAGRVLTDNGAGVDPTFQVPTTTVTTNFSPTIKFGGGNTGITYTSQTGRSYKSGKQVVVICDIVLSSKGSSTGSATIEGLPETAVISGGGYFAYYANMALMVPSFSEIDTTTTTVNLFSWGLTTVTPLDDTNFTNTSRIIAVIIYGV